MAVYDISVLACSLALITPIIKDCDIDTGVEVDDDHDGHDGDDDDDDDDDDGFISNILVNDPNLDLTGQNTQSETTLVLGSGDVVCAAFNDSGSAVGGAQKLTGFSRSTDGGNTWTDKGALPDDPSGDGGDPVLTRSRSSGTIFLSTLQSTGSGIQVFRSTNNCKSFNTPVQGAPGKTGFQDKEWITVDNYKGSGQGNVYLLERDFGPGNGIFFFRSTDDGLTFGPSGGTLIAPGATVQGSFVTVGPDHAVYAFWFEGSATPRIRMRKSTDLGVTFGAAVDVVTLAAGLGANGDLGLNGGFRTNAFPQAAVNPANGDVYVVFNNNPDGADQANVFLVLSRDGGATWGAPSTINDDATSNDQWFPTLAVTPNGKQIFVSFYDRRLDAGNSLIDVFGAIGDVSSGAVTFGPNFRLTDASFPVVVGQDPALNPTYMGDYDQAVADNEFFYVTWGDNRLADPNIPTIANQPDVRFARVPTTW